MEVLTRRCRGWCSVRFHRRLGAEEDERGGGELFVGELRLRGGGDEGDGDGELVDRVDLARDGVGGAGDGDDGLDVKVDDGSDAHGRLVDDRFERVGFVDECGLKRAWSTFNA